MSLDLLCLGEPLVELNQARPGEPWVLLGHGGDTANVAVAAARLGLRVGYLTRIGTDAFGESFLELWRREGVDHSAVIRDPAAPTGAYFVGHGPFGHSFSYLRFGSAASRLAPEDLPEAYVRDTRVLHASAISQAISTSACDAVFRAFEIVRGAGGLVSYDTNYRARLWPVPRARAIVREAAAMAHILLPALDDLRALLGLEDPDALLDRVLAWGPEIVAMTLGPRGALVATARRRERFPGHRVEAVDATGAGDAFDGAFLAEYLRTGDPFRAGRFANAAAALATTGFGAVAPLPTRARVEALLRAAEGTE
ncbi:MAG: sugar kinase [Geminicoccaceae bacterium]|nr:sugar kinase [Geminicoccaceae bacterium]MCX7629264.1 sugar kinase [Geminicoccaceae bacterium]MDW8340426.1 sugar kinase [Geminicoccaceae bacterium]